MSSKFCHYATWFSNSESDQEQLWIAQKAWFVFETLANRSHGLGGDGGGAGELLCPLQHYAGPGCLLSFPRPFPGSLRPVTLIFSNRDGIVESFQL